MPDIKIQCLGRFIQAKMTDRKCPECRSLQVCIKETTQKPKKLYISLRTIDNKELKKALSEMKNIFITRLMKAGLKLSTATNCWKLIQRLCVLKDIKPHQVTILDINDYLEMISETPYLQPSVSNFRRIARDYYQWDNWDIIKYEDSKFTMGERTRYPQELYDTPIYKHWEHWYKIKSPSLSDRSKTQWKGVYKRFLLFCYQNEVTTIDDIHKLFKLAHEWIQTTDIKKTTKKLYRMILKQYFETGLEAIAYKLYVPKIKNAKSSLKKPPSEKEVRLLLHYFKVNTDESMKWKYALFGTLTYTGIRIRDICRLRIDDINLDKNIIFVEESKTGDMEIQIVYPLRTILKSYIDYIRKTNPDQEYLFEKEENTPPRPGYIRELLRNTSKTLGIPYYPPHHYRTRIAITIYRKSGYNKDFVKDFLGHKSIKTTEEYLNSFRIEIMRQDYSKFIPDLGT